MSSAPAQPSLYKRPLKSLKRISGLKKTLAVAMFGLLSGSVMAEDLLQIYSLAVNNDPRIREARATFNGQHTQIDQGRSQLLPTINLQATSSRDTQGTDGTAPPNPNGGGFGTRGPHSFGNGFNTKGYSLNLNQNLINFQAWYAYKALRKSDQVAALNLAEQEQQLIMRVATAYFDVLRAQADLTSLQAEEAAANQLFEQTQQRFDVGLIPITDVNDSRFRSDAVTVRRLQAENILNQRFEALEAITGIDYTNVASLSPEFPITAPETSLDEWTALTRDNNYALKSAELTLEARKDEARAARAALYPTLQLGMSYRWNETGGLNLFGTNLPNINSSVGVTFSAPLFAGGLNRARMRQAYYNRDASEAVLLRTQRESTQSISNSYRTVETDVRAVAAQAQAIVSAQSSLEANTVGAEVGTRNIVDVVQAQGALFQAQRDYANARIQYVMDTLTLKQNAGVLTPQDVIDLNQWLVQ
jgi:outer membrane protein